MRYGIWTAWDVFKRFLFGWLIVAAVLVIVSCIKYKEFIITAFTNNTWAWINAAMPVVIMIFAIGYMIKTAFK